MNNRLAARFTAVATTKVAIFATFLLLLILPNRVHAFHIVGADMYYECIDTVLHRYRITLKLYRDCSIQAQNNNAAPYDGVIELFIFETNTGVRVGAGPSINKPSNTPMISPTVWGNCTPTPPDICVQEGIYTTIVTLPPKVGGYDIAWARCCRNTNISNPTSPSAEGVTFLVHVPDPGAYAKNSSPIFNQRPPVFLCLGQLFSFDHSATDADGDSLVYAITDPYGSTDFFGTGAFQGSPRVASMPSVLAAYGNIPSNPMGPPPYENIGYAFPFSFSNAFGSGNLLINAQTGYITVTPNQLGVFVLAISCYEYRNGVLLSENKRDLQISVINCLPPPPPPVISPNLSSLTHNGDTVIVYANTAMCFPVTVQSPSGTASLISSAIGTAFGNGATYTVTGSGGNPVTAQVCWTPSCNFANQIVQLVFSGQDNNYCQNTASVFDTVWVHIIPPPSGIPVISPDLSTTTFNGDTVLITATQSFCFPVTIQIPGLSSIPLNVTATGGAMTGGATFTKTGTNPVTGQICWTPSCNAGDQLFPIIFTAQTSAACNTVPVVKDTIWVKVSLPPNATPIITPNYGGLTVSGDTVQINAGNAPCYTFTVFDPDTFPVTITPVLSPVNGVTMTLSGINPVVGTVCWSSDCSFEGQIIQIRIGVTDQKLCGPPDFRYIDTWIKVNTPQNSAPVVVPNLGGVSVVGDTIMVLATKPFCYTYDITDPDIGDSVTATLVSPIFTATNGPTVTVTGSNPMQVKICWQPDCAFKNQLIPFEVQLQDQGSCSNVATIIQKMWVRVIVPPNSPPVISYNTAGLSMVNDTILISGLDSLCYSFQILDPNLTDSVDIQPISPVFSQPDAPTVNFFGINPVFGQICWRPSCAYVGQVVKLELQASDNAPCNTKQTVTRAIYVKVSIPPNAPPLISVNLAGNLFKGDTLFVPVDTSFCFSFGIQDLDASQTLAPFIDCPLNNSPLAPTFSVSGTNPLTGTVCWKADCAYEGLIFPITIGAEDNGKCNSNLVTSKTIYVKVPKPITIPPLVSINLAGTNHINSTIYANQGERFCFTFRVVDLTTNFGATYSYRFVDKNNLDLGLGALAVVKDADTIKGSVCFTPSCRNGGSTYRLIITGYDEKFCPPFDSTSMTIYLKVNGEDFGAFAGPDVQFCEGQGNYPLNVVPINGLPAYSYDWYCNDPPNCGYSNPHIPNPTINPTKDNLLAIIQITDTLGCTSEPDTVAIDIRPLPIIRMPKDTFICEGAPGVFLKMDVLNNGPDDAPGPYQVRWTPSAGLNGSTLAMPYALPSKTTTYQVSVTSATGCNNDNLILGPLNSVTVEVRALPIAEAGPPKDICLGDTVRLDGFASGGGLPYQFAWTPASTGFMSNPAEPNPLVSPTKTTTYSLVVAARGCTGIVDTATITVHQIPAGSAGTDASVCYGRSAPLTATTLSNGAYTYHWSPGKSLSDSTAKNPVATLYAATKYTLRITGETGCESPLYQVNVAVNTSPIASAGVNVSICRGDSVTLIGAMKSLPGPFTNPVELRWTPATGLDDPTILRPIATPQQSTTYSFIATHLACADTAQVTITVLNGPMPAIAADTDEICAGTPLQLHASGGVGDAHYTWTPEVTGSNPQHPVVKPMTTTDYTVLVQEGPCSAIATMRITVHPTPTPDFYLALSGCDTVQALFQANSPTAIAYIWDFGDESALSNEEQATRTYVSKGVRTVTYSAIGQYACRADSTFSFNVARMPQVDYLSTPSWEEVVYPPLSTYQFTPKAEEAPGLSYAWDFGDGQYSHSPTAEHTYPTPGVYDVRLTVSDGAGCSKIVSYRYTVSEPTLFIPNVLTPNADGFNDTWAVQYNGAESFSATVYDRWGRIMFETAALAAWNGVNNGSPAADGVYFYVVQIGAKMLKGEVTLAR